MPQYGLSQEQTLIVDSVRDFSAQKLAPNAMKWEEAKTLDRAILREMAQMGLAGIYVNEDVGGSGLGRFDAVLIFEELSKGCISHAAFVSIHNMCCRMIDGFASNEMRQKWLPLLVTMDKIISYCLTEPASGSDAASLQTRARETTFGYVLNGTKTLFLGPAFPIFI